MKSKKHVLCFYQVYENDSLKDYLEDMALKGWKLTKFDNFFLHFQSCTPHRIRYCVEVMTSSSPFASNLTPALTEYREFCRDAGWDYVGTNGYLHVFYTEDAEAIPVETDSQERFHNICRAATGVYRTFGLLFVLLGLLNAQICYQKKTLLCSHGAVILLLLGSALWSAGDFLRWKKRARLSLSRTGTLPSTPWKTVCRKNIAVYCLVLLFVVSMFFATFSRISSDTRIFIIPYLTVYVLLLFVFSWLIHLLREKCAFSKTVNLVIYWGAAVLMGAVITTILAAAIFWYVAR